MISCNICSIADEHDSRRPTGSGGKMFQVLKQRGKTKYSPNGINFECIYACQLVEPNEK